MHNTRESTKEIVKATTVRARKHSHITVSSEKQDKAFFRMTCETYMKTRCMLKYLVVQR
jgi:hypothetical protein